MTKKFYEIGKLLTVIRKRGQLSQSQLSLMLGYKNGQFVSNVERGLCSLPARVVVIINKELNVPKEVMVDAMKRDFINNLNKSVGLSN